MGERRANKVNTVEKGNFYFLVEDGESVGEYGDGGGRGCVKIKDRESGTKRTISFGK